MAPLGVIDDSKSSKGAGCTFYHQNGSYVYKIKLPQEASRYIYI